MTDVNLKTVGANELVNARTGEVVSLESLWQGPQPVVITFLRRFGCAVCRWCARELSTGMARANLPAGAVRLVAVASERIGLQEFLDGNFFSGGDLFIDDKKQCYNDLGFKRYNALSIIPVALGKKVRDIVAKAVEDGVSGNLSGDLLQTGGCLIVSAGGEKVLLCFRQDSPGDFVPVETVLEVLGFQSETKAQENAPQPECTDVCSS
ncbi:prostamide/prostaglandin F synthase [Lampetra planeri]